MKLMTNKTKIQNDPRTTKKLLLSWYDATHRKLPWRHVGPQLQDPYPIWISEIMLQQTTVQTVEPYFIKFMKRWPTIEALASADLEEVLSAWQGLGYYHRAKNLHKAAQVLVHDRGGVWPMTHEALLALPGIGGYTSKAISAIAFQQPVVPVDGNIKRVIARLHGLWTPLDRLLKETETVLEAYADKERPGDFAQALMDLGARVCTPKNPKCTSCPFQSSCYAFSNNKVDELPKLPLRVAKPHRKTRAYVCIAEDCLLLRKRPHTGLLAHMMEVPTGHWCDISAFDHTADPYMDAPFEGEWQKLDFTVIHVFTHFKLEVEVYGIRLSQKRETPYLWVPLITLEEKPLPTLVKKIMMPALEKLKMPLEVAL
ncbi:MAG: A/G-specific adenine glycosylase [Candidatus Nucleicultricaceae bacterium]